MKPAIGKKCELKANLKYDPKDEGDAGFSIKWRGFHPKMSEKVPLKDRRYLDNRKRTINKCEFWEGLKVKIKDNVAKVRIESTVPHDAWKGDTNSLEIYAAIRAEYKYIVGNGYRKLGSRIDGNNGIDHLFVKDGKIPVIVESKTISDLSHVTKLVGRQNHNAIISELGEGRLVNGGVAIATQMSKKWILECIDGISNKLSGEVKHIAEQIYVNINAGVYFPERILNVYGGLNWNADGLYDELVATAERQFAELEDEEKPKVTDRTLTNVISTKYARSTKNTKKGQTTGENELLFIWKEWHTYNPKRGRFYLLPGKYSLRNRSSQFVGKLEDATTVDFANRQYKNEEFFNIDKLDSEALKRLDKLKKRRRNTTAITQASK